MKKNAMNKEREDSRELSEGLHNGWPGDSDSDPDSIGEAEASLYEAFSRLRAVRVPGKRKLTMQEAMEAASDQYQWYRTWKSKGGPLGKLKASVEGKEVFKALGPPVFESFGFNWPPLNDGVLQITTEYEREQVVLYSLRLQDVPQDRTVYKETLPNGQHLVLTITRRATLAASAGSSSLSSQTETFSINIAIQSQPGSLDLNDRKENRAEKEDAEDTKKSRAKFAPSDMISRRPRLAAFGRPTAAIAYGVVVVLLAFLLVQNESLKMLMTSNAAGQSKVLERESDFQASNLEQQDVQAPLAEVVKTELESPVSTPVIAADNRARQNRIKAESARNRKPTADWQLSYLVPTPDSPRGEAVAMVKIAASESWKTQSLAVTSDQRLARYKELEERFAAIAARPHISVRVRNSEATQAAKAELVRSLFARAFRASPRFKVLNDSDRSKAELVIGLRFERTEHASGFVFVDIRDSNGKFIWQDFANCAESRPDQPGETFTVAASLVSSLEEVMNTSK